MKSFDKVLLLTAFFLVKQCYARYWVDPDTNLNLYQFIENHGYYYENYTITTEDGYILHTVRIPNAKNNNATNCNGTKCAVLILHGIWSNPEDLIMSGDKSIGFLLVENGFDVFLMASRGNTYSTEHVNLSTDSAEYWDFSWHEIGYYDIPANIDLISEVTGNQNVSFIGHSQGGTAFLVLAATRPEYAKRIIVSHLFAPVVYMEYTRLPIKPLINNVYELENIVTALNWNSHGLFTYSPLIEPIAELFCARDAPTIEICVALFGLFGPDPKQLNRSLITVMASNDPAGGSFKEVLHYFQVTKNDKFRQYDYGVSNNLEVYNEIEPPLYDLTSNTVQIHIWYGANDYFCGVKDFERLIKETKNAISKKVDNELWNHIDFAFAIEGPRYVYNAVINNIKELTSS